MLQAGELQTELLPATATNSKSRGENPAHVCGQLASRRGSTLFTVFPAANPLFDSFLGWAGEHLIPESPMLKQILANLRTRPI